MPAPLRRTCGSAALTAVVMGVFISFVFGYFALVMKGAMNACGVAVNLIATGGTVFVLVMLTGSKANSSALKSLTFPVVNIRCLGYTGPGDHIFRTKPGYLHSVGIVAGEPHGCSIRQNWASISGPWERTRQRQRQRGLSVLKHQLQPLPSVGYPVPLEACIFHGALLNHYNRNGGGKGLHVPCNGCHEPGQSIVGCLSSLLYGFSDTITVYLQLYSKDRPETH